MNINQFIISLIVGAIPAMGATVELNVSGMAFMPKSLIIQVGDTVEFTNNSSFPHSFTGDPAKAKDPANVILPDGAETFDSGLLAQGQKFSHTFTVPGHYQYICTKHEAMGMIGTIHVESGGKGRVAKASTHMKGFDCEAYYFKGDQGVDVKMSAKNKGGYYLVEEELKIGDRTYGVYVYYDGQYSAINIGRNEREEYYNSDAEVEVGKLFSLFVEHPSLKPDADGLGVSCRGF